MWTMQHKRNLNVAIGNVRKLMRDAPPKISEALELFQTIVSNTQVDVNANHEREAEPLSTCGHCQRDRVCSPCGCGEPVCKQCKSEMAATGDICDAG